MFFAALEFPARRDGISTTVYGAPASKAEWLARELCAAIPLAPAPEAFVGGAPVPVLQFRHFSSAEAFIGECGAAAYPDAACAHGPACPCAKLAAFLADHPRAAVEAAGGVGAVRVGTPRVEIPTAPARENDLPGVAPARRAQCLNLMLLRAGDPGGVAEAGPPLRASGVAVEAWEYPARLVGDGGSGHRPAGVALLQSYLSLRGYPHRLGFEPNVLLCWERRPDGTVVFRPDGPAYDRR